MNNNINGQIWIDKNSPFKLKYIANNKTYSVDVSIEYEIGEYSTDHPFTFDSGTVLAFDGTTNLVKKAVFPDDLDNVIGVAGNAVTQDNRKLFILKSGSITLTESEITNMFGSDFSLSANLIGKPVYWNIGSYEENNGSYSFSYDKEADAGKLTLNTPSRSNSTINVEYDNLPIIGNVEAVDTVEKTLTIFLNVGRFDTSLEWIWPADPNGSSVASAGSVLIRHGLLSQTSECFCNILKVESNGKTNPVSTTIDNVVTIDNGIIKDQYTEIYLEPGAYKITGSVNYKFKAIT